ncbi:DUF5667 domain-containing protein [Symbioplanes lichenis]|uniref:DUF5667 domain-containing protein n=1 Tax=Symbioplanes lichenis TaxID=1629072 RepID=UPI002739DF7A|nr:DUF5667 domain-containing protein [Actinoplanes lichenis]
MRLDFFDRRSAERFAELLDTTDAGRGQHARGQADDQLAELVAIAHSLSAARPGAQVDPEFRTGLRAMLVAAAERDGIGATAPAADEESEAAAPVRKLFGRTGRRIRARGVIVIGVAASAMAVSGISAASESAAPGDALYGVKRSTERAQLAMAGSDITRGQLSLTFARNRLAEAAAMRGDDVKFRDALDDMDADTKQGVKLLTSGAVTRKETTGLASVDSFVDSQRRLLTPAVDRLGPVNQERAQKSLSLLDAVEKRSKTLRERLGCSPVPAVSGSDALGPKLGQCETRGSTKSSGGTEKHQGRRDQDDQKSATSEKDTKTTKDGTDEEPRPGKSSPQPGSSSKTAGPSGDEDDQGDAGADDISDMSTTSPTDPADEDSPEPVISVDPANPPTDAEKGLLGGLLGNLFGNK